MTANDLFNELYQNFRHCIEHATGDRSFAGRVTLRVEDEHGNGSEASVRCQHNTGPEWNVRQLQSLEQKAS